jgi:hypothetical protein
MDQKTLPPVIEALMADLLYSYSSVLSVNNTSENMAVLTSSGNATRSTSEMFVTNPVIESFFQRLPVLGERFRMERMSIPRAAITTGEIRTG